VSQDWNPAKERKEKGRGLNPNFHKIQDERPVPGFSLKPSVKTAYPCGVRGS
jgi:hypothetical protein